MTSNQLAWLRRLDTEHDNLRAALAWTGQAPSRCLAGLRLARALHRYWYQRGYAREGRHWLSEAIANYDASSLGRSASDERSLARALVADGWLSVIQGDYRARPAGLERGLDLARQLDDPATEAQALGLISLLAGYRGDEAAVTRQYDQASLESARRSGDTWTLAWVVHLVGLHSYYQWGEAGAARRALEESAALFARIGDRRWLAVVVNLRGIITAHDGDYAAAQALYEGALAIAQELDDQDLQWKELFNLGGLAVVQSDSARAADLYTRAVALGRRLGSRLSTADGLQGLAQVHLMRRELAAAEACLRESLSLLSDAGPANLYVRLLSKFARVAAERGQTTRAARALGAIEAFLAQHPILIDVDERLPLAEHRAWAQAAMPSEAFEAACTQGRALTLEQAMQDVLEALPAPGAAAALPAETSAAPPPPPLRLYALGTMRAEGEGATPIAWPYAKVKELLFYLASFSARTKAQIGLALWPEASSAQLRNSLGTTLYHLRRTLGRPEWVLFEDDQYRYNRALGGYFDVDAFEASLAQAARIRTSAPEQALAYLQDAANRYQGDFVEDLLDGEWFRLRRETLRRKYLDGLLDLGQLHFARGHYATAAAAYRRAIEKENVLESAHRELMRCYERLGERGQALRHYQTLAQVMRTELGAAPAPESVALYDQLKRGTGA